MGVKPQKVFVKVIDPFHPKKKFWAYQCGVCRSGTVTKEKPKCRVCKVVNDFSEVKDNG